MCGVVAIHGAGPVNQRLLEALTMLQHRGQDAAGVVVSDGERMYLRKSLGMVDRVFRQEHMDWLRGHTGIGHVRYPTAGVASDPSEVQPMYVGNPYGIAVAHNGNLTNASELRRDLYAGDLRHMNTGSDSEVLVNVLAQELQRSGSLVLRPEDVFAAVGRLHQRCEGAYSAVALVQGQGILAFRDPWGIRPLVLGRRDGNAPEYMIASESAALDLHGFELVRDVAAGEALFVDTAGQLHAQVCAANPQRTPCIFEHVYLARPDSVIDGVSVYQARLRMGERLALRMLEESDGDPEVDVVIPIPDTARTAALPLAHRLGVEYREGFVKNRYIARTFIMPDQQERQHSVRQKFNIIRQEFAGRRVLLVDDSIVRGNTMRQLVMMARTAGARSVKIASACPEVRYPNVYGIDMPSCDELIAHGRSHGQIAASLGVDRIYFQRLADLIECTSVGSDIEAFECSVFDGNYVTGTVSADYLKNLPQERTEGARLGQVPLFDDGGVELHNRI